MALRARHIALPTTLYKASPAAALAGISRLCERAARNAAWLPDKGDLNRGEIVLDSFLGGGTTVMAAERTGRHCYGLEIDARYVDTIIRRWQTGHRRISTSHRPIKPSKKSSRNES